MKYVGCDLIEHGLVFYDRSINLCCRQVSENNKCKEIISDYNGELLNLDRLFALKRFYRNKMKSGEIFSVCRGCPNLREKEYDDEDYIDTIKLNHGNICNCKCIYCPTALSPETPFRYNAFPVIKQLAESGYLKKEGSILMSGGEPVIADDFSDLLTLFLDLDFHNIKILTNGVVCSDLITGGIRRGNVNILVSVDAGTPQMYRWIKGSDSYKFVWDNLKIYAENQNNKSLVKTKYVIIPTINDIKEEVKMFLDKSEECGISQAVFDIENFWYLENKDNIPSSLKEFLKFTEEETNKRNLSYLPIGRASGLIEKTN